MRWTRLASILLGCSLLQSVSPAATFAQQERDILGEQCVLTLPGMESVQVDTGIVYREVAGETLKLDFFHPRERSDSAKRSRNDSAGRAPLVIFANGVGLSKARTFELVPWL